MAQAPSCRYIVENEHRYIYHGHTNTITQDCVPELHIQARHAGSEHSQSDMLGVYIPKGKKLGLNTTVVVHCRHAVQPDGQLYSSLMDVAGQAKRVDLAFDLQADMVAQGLQPSKVEPPPECCCLQYHAVLLPSMHAYVLSPMTPPPLSPPR